MCPTSLRNHQSRHQAGCWFFQVKDNRQLTKWIDGRMNVYGGHRGEPWWTLSLHGQPPSCLCSAWVARMSMWSLGSNPASGAARVSLSLFWGRRIGNECLEKEAGVCFIYRLSKAETSWAKLVWALTTISVQGWGLLLTNLVINRFGFLKHRLTYPHSFLVRWELHGTCQNFFL